MVNKSSNYNNFDFVRFLLASFVIISHSVPLTGNGVSYTSILTRGQLDLGDLAVAMFFVISGYLVVGSYIRINNVFRYLQHRVLRIFPALILLLMVVIVVVGPIIARQPLNYYLNGYNFYLYVKNIFLKRQFAQHVFDSYAPSPFHSTINGSLWTLPLEFSCYMMVALLGVLRLLKKHVLVFLFIVNICLYANFSVLSGSAVVLFTARLHFPLELWFKLSGYFCIGGCYYFYRSQIQFSKKYLLPVILILLLSAQFSPTLTVILPVLGSYVLFYLVFNPAIKLQDFGKFGDFSYGIYLYGFLMQQLVIMYYGGQMSNTLNYMISLPLAIVMGAISYYCVERPSMRLKL